MAENPSNGHASNGSQNPDANGAASAPVLPRVAAPQGARSARTYDGSPVEVDAATVQSAPAIEEVATQTEGDDAASDDAASDDAAPDGEALSEEPPAFSETAYRADLQDAFPEALISPRLAARASAPPLDIDISDDETNGFGDYAADDYATDASENYASDLAVADNFGAGITGADMIEGEQLFADDGAGGDGGAPPNGGIAQASGGGGRPDTPRDQEAGLFDHLSELRSRLLYAALGVMAIMCLTWNYALPIQGWFSAPITHVLKAHGNRGELISTDPTAFFTLQFQSSLLAALLLGAPWVLFQVWRFIEPALTNSERRYTLVLVPFSSILFFMGAALGYAVSPLFFQFFLQFQPPGVAAQWKYDESVILMAKMLLIFGLAFQVPIIIIFANKIGLISRNLLIEYWRHAVVVIFIVVAVLTPTWDPFTMTACALPPCLLYLLSIWLVKWL